MRGKGKTRAPITKFAISVIIISLFLAVIGFLITYVICVDRVSEFSNGRMYQNNWYPLSGSFLDYLFQLPKALYDVVFLVGIHSFAALVLFPVVLPCVILYDTIVLNSYELLLKGVLPFFAGLGGLLWAVYLQDTHRVPKVEPLEFDD